MADCHHLNVKKSTCSRTRQPTLISNHSGSKCSYKTRRICDQEVAKFRPLRKFLLDLESPTVNLFRHVFNYYLELLSKCFWNATWDIQKFKTIKLIKRGIRRRTGGQSVSMHRDDSANRTCHAMHYLNLLINMCLLAHADNFFQFQSEM